MQTKVADIFDELEAGCDRALAQIEEQKYDTKLRKDGYQNIIEYGKEVIKNFWRYADKDTIEYRKERKDGAEKDFDLQIFKYLRAGCNRWISKKRLYCRRI